MCLNASKITIEMCSSYEQKLASKNLPMVTLGHGQTLLFGPIFISIVPILQIS